MLEKCLLRGGYSGCSSYSNVDYGGESLFFWWAKMRGLAEMHNTSKFKERKMSGEYKKTLEDEIDWKVIDQLHNATLKFSATSLELKKILFVLVGILTPAIIKMSGGKLDMSLFITMYLLLLTFWFLDSFTYYYQEKLRSVMNSRFEQIRARNAVVKPVNTLAQLNNEGETIESSRDESKRKFRSFLNSSMCIYPVLIALNSIGFVLFCFGVIR